MQHYQSEQWDRASSSKYSYPHPRTMDSDAYAGGASRRDFQQVSSSCGSGGGQGGRVGGRAKAKKALGESRQRARLGPMDTVDDFLTNESGNSLMLCVLSILLVFPGSTCLIVIGGAFTLDQQLQQQHQWVRPCAIFMLILGVILLITACVIFTIICRPYWRARACRLGTATAAEGSPYTCVVQL
ncbi:hypothetical protein BOX15_Mlig029391g1 [Macrostomum lignano]|uniref:Uncharacterized protein n=1 Tax=Macrostomum lignano TaxID=282301 RepID=A0A267GJ80_9PLAT|nr:hypothetical protein BOX15_Mlig029391g1 [Macrostomum lignano]